MIKRYRKETPDLTQGQLAVHETLRDDRGGGGAVSRATVDPLGEIKLLAYLGGGGVMLARSPVSVHSGRSAYTYFTQVKNLYRKLKQNGEAMH
jgi:hypothetical protein